MAEKTKQGRHNAATMYPLMELFEDSEMTQKQFCVEMDLVPHTFTYWLNKYRKTMTNAVAKASKPEFVELAVSSNGASSMSLHRLMRITYPDGTLVELPIQ